MKQVVSEEDLLFGLVLIEQCLFAEFFFHDDLNLGLSLEQKMMFCDESQRVCFCCGRKVAKTVYLESRIIQIGMTHTGEGMFFTPSVPHLAPVRNRVVSRIAHNVLFDMFQTSFNRAEGIQTWRKGAWTWHWRIEGLCLSGDARVITTEGALPIAEMVEEGYSVLSVAAETFSQSTVSGASVRFMEEQEGFEVILSDGWSLKATANHPLLAPTGWKRVDELGAGDLVAVVRSLPPPSGGQTLSAEESRLLGYFVGDGGLTRGYPRFTCFEDAVWEDVVAIVARLFPEVEPKSSRRGNYELTCGNRGGIENPLHAFFREHQIDCLAHEKRVPRAVMQGNLEVVANFLSGLWATDGSIVKSGKRVFLTYSSSSRGLIDDVLFLLLKLGIRARIKIKPAHWQTFPGDRSYQVKEQWEISTSEAQSLIAFEKLITVVGRKGQRLTDAAISYAAVEKAHRIDAIPSSIVKTEVQKSGLSHNEVARRMGYADGSKFIWGYRTCSMRVAKKVNAIIHSPILENLLSGCLGWRKIKSIASLGMMDTYDMRVPGTNSFVANGFVVHNTGTDKNMVGLRASTILGDEVAFSTMVCHNSREMVALPHCKWVYAGVPNQWRSGTLYVIDKTQRGTGWSHHKLTAYDNPMNRGREEEFERLYKGTHTAEYQTQVLGEWGDELARTFPPGAIAQNTAVPFWTKAFGYTLLHHFISRPSEQHNLKGLFNLPRVGATRYAMGIDYGYSPDPTEIMIAYEGKEDCWYELARLRLIAVPYHVQAKIVHILNELLDYQLIGIGVEYVGAGLNIAQELQRTDTTEPYSQYCNYARILINSNPGGTIEVPVVSPTDILVETAKELGVPYIPETEMEMVKLRRKNWMTELYRDAMIRANNDFPGLKFWVASDEDLIESTINVAEKRTQQYVVYDKLDKDVPDHPVDAARNLMCAIVEGQVAAEVSIVPIAEYGWAGRNAEWRPPW